MKIFVCISDPRLVTDTENLSYTSLPYFSFTVLTEVFSFAEDIEEDLYNEKIEQKRY